MREDDDKVLLERVRGFDDERADAATGRDNTAVILGERRRLSEPLSDGEARRRMALHSRRGFLVGGAAALVSIFGWRWMSDESKSSLLRGAFKLNERVSQAFYRPSRLAPEFSPLSVTGRRVNGMIGMENPLDDAANWRLSVAGIAGRTEDLVLSLEDLRRLPRTEMTTELKCIEGWSIVVNWAGVRFSDFTAAYPPQTISGSPADLANRPQDIPPYVSISTPDRGYFVGWDTPSIMHPQTLLAYEMNGAPLLPEHGAPLRIASPTKYGIKQIKRIGRIEFVTERPRDYWAEEGYDWYAGH
ncbi:MAG: molybdopterin-dependent oxidoreductase [Pyrinomonadaceae bacterium]